jgi:hypothetical protein
MIASVLTTFTLVGSVFGHALFQHMWVNDVDQGAWCARTPTSNSPVSNVGSAVSTYKLLCSTLNAAERTWLATRLPDALLANVW